MPMIQVKNLTFVYDGSYEPVFENASFTIDTDWKLGFIARNGRGKTTFLNLLMGKYPYQGQIIADEAFDYFPFDPPQALCMVQALEMLCPGAQLWALEREASLMQVKPEALWQPFQTLSKGEQTKLLLAALFVREGRFLLIDEPTNHLDAQGRRSVARYLKSKRGFILVSHDRDFLDEAVDHVLVINKKTIEVQKGNFSSWWENKTRRDQFEQAQNEKLAGQISQLTQAMRRTQQWSDKVEKTKYAKSAGGDANRGFVDKGFIGAQSARMMKRAKAIETRIQSAIDEKSGLLADLEKAEALKLHPLSNLRGALVTVSDLSVRYGAATACRQVRLSVRPGQRIALCGPNGCGKSSVLHAILGDLPPHAETAGQCLRASGLVISFARQDASDLCGMPRDFARHQQLDETLFFTILRKLDFSRPQFERDMAGFSAGQKKKVLLAASLCRRAHLYIWDEPLNYIDVFSRMQIEQLIDRFSPTLLFVEHDAAFCRRIATDTIVLPGRAQQPQ